MQAGGTLSNVIALMSKYHGVHFSLASILTRLYLHYRNRAVISML